MMMMMMMMMMTMMMVQNENTCINKSSNNYMHFIYSNIYDHLESPLLIYDSTVGSE